MAFRLERCVPWQSSGKRAVHSVPTLCTTRPQLVSMLQLSVAFAQLCKI
jgi:hypothetical protein